MRQYSAFCELEITTTATAVNPYTARDSRVRVVTMLSQPIVETSASLSDQGLLYKLRLEALVRHTSRLSRKSASMLVRRGNRKRRDVPISGCSILLRHRFR